VLLPSRGSASGFGNGPMHKLKLVCRYCAASVKDDVRVLTSELRALLLNPFAIAFCIVAVLFFITFWFWQ
jgi:hypothetical protein